MVDGVDGLIMCRAFVYVFVAIVGVQGLQASYGSLRHSRMLLRPRLWLMVLFFGNFLR